MKWTNHKVVTFCAVYSVTGGFLAATSAMVGSVLPDVLELNGLVFPHRTITHYIWIWLALAAGVWFSLSSGGFASIGLYAVFFVVCGAALHICEDALSIGGVPLLDPFGARKGLAVYRTGTLSEYVSVLGLVGVFVAFAWLRGFCQPAYLVQQCRTLSALVMRVI